VSQPPQQQAASAFHDGAPHAPARRPLRRQSLHFRRPGKPVRHPLSGVPRVRQPGKPVQHLLSGVPRVRQPGKPVQHLLSGAHFDKPGKPGPRLRAGLGSIAATSKLIAAGSPVLPLSPVCKQTGLTTPLGANRPHSVAEATGAGPARSARGPRRSADHSQTVQRKGKQLVRFKVLSIGMLCSRANATTSLSRS